MNFDAYKRKCYMCTACKLCESRYSAVWSRGPDDARYMFIGDGPDSGEDSSATPFVGKSGQLLDSWLEAAGIKDAYLTHVVKCRSPMGRAPFMNEMEACFQYLEAQIEFVKPLAIVLMGKAPCDLLHPWDNIARLRDATGTIVAQHGFLFMATYTPAFVLRQTPTIREEMSTSIVGALMALREEVETDE